MKAVNAALKRRINKHRQSALKAKNVAKKHVAPAKLESIEFYVKHNKAEVRAALKYASAFEKKIKKAQKEGHPVTTYLSIRPEINQEKIALALAADLIAQKNKKTRKLKNWQALQRLITKNPRKK